MPPISAVPIAAPASRPAAVAISILPRISSTTIARINKILSSINAIDSIIPTEMKKILVMRSRIGMMIPSTSWLYSDPAMATPARNAPSDMETPASEKTQATPIQMVITEMINSSRFRLPATTSKMRGTSTSATPSTTSSATTRLSPAQKPTQQSLRPHRKAAEAAT